MKTLLIFICAIAFLVSCSTSKAQVENRNSKIENNVSSEKRNLKVESADEKAVRLAEEFIKQNGYTDAPADENNLSHETVEFYNSTDELLESRRDTLQPKAYGFFRKGRSGEKGWTIIFRYNRSKFKMSNKEYNSGGRAVTMNENFENLMVEHKDVYLKAAEVKFKN